MTSPEPIFHLCDRVRSTALELHRHLRHGHLEKVYEKGLLHRLRRQGFAAVGQYPLEVRYEDGTPLGEFILKSAVGMGFSCRESADGWP